MQPRAADHTAETPSLSRAGARAVRARRVETLPGRHPAWPSTTTAFHHSCVDGCAVYRVDENEISRALVSHCGVAGSVRTTCNWFLDRPALRFAEGRYRERITRACGAR